MSESLTDCTLRKKQQKVKFIDLKLNYDSEHNFIQNTSTQEQSEIRYESSKTEYIELFQNSPQKILDINEIHQDYLNYQDSLFYNQNPQMVIQQNEQTIKTKQQKENQRQFKSEQIQNYKLSLTNLQEKSTNLIYQDEKKLANQLLQQIGQQASQNFSVNEQQNYEINNPVISQVKKQLQNRNYFVNQDNGHMGCGFVLQLMKQNKQESKKSYLALTRLIKDQNINKKINKIFGFLKSLEENTKYIEIDDYFQIPKDGLCPDIFVIVLVEFAHTYNFLLNISKIINFFKDNEYYLGRYIAEGGYGVVFEGKIYQNNKLEEVIFKIQFTEHSNQSESEEEFLIMKGFEKNVNLIQAIDYKVIDQNVSVIVMEKCECNLKDKMLQFKEKMSFSFKQLLQIIFDLIDGLILLKTYKIIHLDIKPQNILINHYGIYIVSDFGTSIKNQKDKSVKIKGFTPNYAPEEVRSKNGIVNFESDVYSLGKTLQHVFYEYEKLQCYNLSEKDMLEKFKKIIYEFVLKEESSQRKTCLELHKLFYEVVRFEENQDFSQLYIDKIRLILSQNNNDSNKDIQFFNEVSIYYYEKIIDLKQKIKKSHILNFLETESLSEFTLERVNRISSQEDSEYILIYNQKATYYNEQSQFKRAKEQLQESLQLCNKLFKKGHLYTASTLNKLALFNLKEVGLNYSNQSIQILDNFFKGDCDLKAVYLNTLSWCYKSLSNPEQALKLQEESLKIRSNIFKFYHTRIAVALNNLGTMYQSFDLGKCLKYQLLSLKIRQFLFQENHPCTARSLDCVGQCYLNMGNLEQAKKFLYSSYWMRKQIYQGDIDCIAISLNNIAKYHLKAGEFIKSIFFYKKYFQMMRNMKYEIDYVYVFLYNIAQCLFYQKQFSQTIFILQDFLKIFSKNAAQISKTHIIISLCQFNMGQFQKGLDSLCKSIPFNKNVIQQDIHKLSYLIKHILKRYQLYGYASIFWSQDLKINIAQHLQINKYQQFLRMIYLLILSFQELTEDQKYQLYKDILEITLK